MRTAYGKNRTVLKNSSIVFNLHNMNEIYDISSVDEDEFFGIYFVENSLQAFTYL